MKMLLECVIEPHHEGFGMYQVVEGDAYYADNRQYESDVLSNTDFYTLDSNLPEDIEDIRGCIYNEPDYVYAIRQQDSQGGYIQYVGLVEVEVEDEEA
jgi:hypothetical protein